MLFKSAADEIQSFLSDASNLAGGHAARVVFPETSGEAAEALAAASRAGMPVTVAGAGTGVVGGRVPFGGLVVSTDRLNRILEIVRDEDDTSGPEDGGAMRARASSESGVADASPVRGRATAQAGVMLSEFQRAVEARGLFYPPDPTERSCYLGATVATNSSGARTFKYGPTRAYVRRLEIALASGDLLDLRRGDSRADAEGVLRVRTRGGRVVEARLPSYHMPRTRKHAAGYFVRPGVDAVDLFVGSEGTLGVITELEVSLLARPAGVLSGIVFFDDEARLLAFVREARRLSFDTRARRTPEGGDADSPAAVDARALEYFDAESLNFLREHYPLVPLRAAGAIFFEQETAPDTEDDLMAAWLALLEAHGAMLDDSWFGTNEHDRAEMREFRHKLPVLVNEWLARHGQRKVSTDMAVPDEHFPEMLRFYKETLRARRLQYVVFGHVGDGHVHVNVMPRDGAEAAAARDIYGEFARRAVALGGTISAEHGVGKLKREYLRELYGDAHLREMAALKRAFDPACVLGRGNIFAEELLAAAGQ